ncbi:MAG: malate/lactate/ureidoglycolate dehydrogenase [bacterium]|nr:malate/lactate/ureidoglycolate dehydrogenase [Gammaproteobacteria bacterium]HIL98913.1 malate/lactate/ureidoglycolate dehydrogenase [Pseudomonadales bacterium]
MIVNHAKLTQFVKVVCIAAGSPEAEATAVATHLVEANLKGHDSHGVGMLPIYIRNIKMGFCIPHQHAEIESENGPCIIVDGKLGFGQVVGPEAMDMGLKVAREHGVAVVALKNAHHLGRIGTHAEHVVKEGFISMHYANVVGHDPQVAPFGGTRPRLGTNPFCCAIPVEGGNPVILDMATSAIAAGKVRVARNSGLQVPEGCLIDHEGNETTDPNVVVQDPPGAQTHFGKHKGFGLAFICELLAGALTGAWSVQPGNERQGTVVNHMLTFILNPEVVGDKEKFTSETLALIDWVKSSPAAKEIDSVLIPGEPERIAKADRETNGISIDEVSWEGLLATAEAVEISRQQVDEIVL